MVHGRCTVGFLGKVDASFDPHRFFEQAVSVGSRVGDILSFRVDAYHLSAVNDIPGLVYTELAGCAAPHLDRAVRAARADSVQRGINLPQSYTGRNVLIGVLDWGFDYTHPMFYDTTLTTSRVRAAWDQFRQAGPGPSAFNYGKELTNTPDLMAAQSDTVNIYSNATHGTHVGGIAGGSGAGTQYRGFAFDAQFVFCTWLIDAAGALDGFAWMKSVADLDQKRLVVNCSWGLYYMGTLDGNSLISQAINQLSQQGVVFCNSGGNNGDVNFHLKKNFGGDTLRSIIQIYPYSAHPRMWGQSITMWGDVGAEFAAGITITNNANQMLAQSPWYHTSNTGLCRYAHRARHGHGLLQHHRRCRAPVEWPSAHATAREEYERRVEDPIEADRCNRTRAQLERDRVEQRRGELGPSFPRRCEWNHCR